MAKVFIKVNVAYPNTFLGKLETQTEYRKRNGELAITSATDNDIHNIVYVISDWDSAYSAKKFWSSLEAKLQIADWHSVGIPEIRLLRECSKD